MSRSIFFLISLLAVAVTFTEQLVIQPQPLTSIAADIPSELSLNAPLPSDNLIELNKKKKKPTTTTTRRTTTKPSTTTAPPSTQKIKASCTANHSGYTVGAFSGIEGENYRWRNGFNVQLDSAFNDEEVQEIYGALGDLNNVLCISIGVWPQNSEPQGDYAFIKRANSGGCTSPVGKQGGMQTINLQAEYDNGATCVTRDTITHESIHSLGFYHEQSRTDRDSFVNIFPENMIPGYEFAFDIAEGSNTYDVEYDLKSIMHYESTAFTKNGQPTILAKDGDFIPRNTVMSSSDVQKLRRMYNCE